MLSREEQKLKNQLFWSDFRDLMVKVKSSNGRKINWLNYPSDVKDIYIRLHVDSKSAKLCFDIQSRDSGIRSIIWEQMTELKKIMEVTMGCKGIWDEQFYNNEGVAISQIKWEKHGVNFYDENHKREIFEFLKEKLVAFDLFYQEFKEVIINLTH
jgi:hypothetical protein